MAKFANAERCVCVKDFYHAAMDVFARIASLAFLAMVAGAEKPEKPERYEASYIKTHTEVEVGYSEAVARIKSSDGREIKSLASNYQRAGDFTNLQLVSKEVTRFEASESLRNEDLVAEPATLARLQQGALKSLSGYRQLYIEKMTKLESGFLRALGTLRTDLTKAGNIEGATMVNARMTQAESDLKKHQSEAPAPPPPEPPAKLQGAPKLRLWISGDKGVTADAGGFVSEIVDQEQGAFRATQENDGQQPRLVKRPTGNGIINFDGKDDRLQFNGSGFVPRSRQPQMTVACWVKNVGRGGGAKGFRPIFGISSGARPGTHVTVGLGHLEFDKPGDVVNVSHGGKEKQWTTRARCPSNWTLIAYVHDGRDDIIYFNGKEIARESAQFSILTGAKVWLGGWDDIDGKSRYFGGFIHDLRLWDKALNGDTLRKLEQAERPKFE